MERRSRILNVRALVPALLIVGALAFGCSEDDTPPTGVMPDFAVTDVNPNSSTYSQIVSPRNFLEKISAYYFTHTT